MKQILIIVLIALPSLFVAQVDHWETIVYNTDTWSYFIGNVEPPSNWNQTNFNDSAWLKGIGGIGYADEDDNTIIPKTHALYIRHTFSIVDLEAIETLILQADYDDGYVAYLNGVEIARANIIGSPPRYDTNTITDHEATLFSGGQVEPVTLSAALQDATLRAGENVLAIQVHNRNGLSSSDMTSNFFLTAGINNSTQYYRDTPDWFFSPNFTTHLPIFRITTQNNINAEERVEGTLEIIHSPDGVNESTGEANEYEGPISIKYRGESSLWFPKKGYSFETKDETGADRDTSFLNFPAEEDWILHGPYSDKSLMRNVLTMELARRMGQYASRTEYCELFVNGDYQGIYVLMEQIKRDKGRVDISKLKEEDIEGDELTGGYIYRIDKGETDWFSNYAAVNNANNNSNLGYQLVYPDIDKVQPEQLDYIKTHVDSFERAMRLPSLSYGGKSMEDYIDLKSFAEAHLLNELGRNVDGYRLSSYFHKKKDSQGGKIHAGPVWDFNLAFRNADYCFGAQTTGLIFDVLCDSDFPFWWETLLSHAPFNDLTKCRWNELRSGSFHQDAIFAFIDEQAAYLEPAVQRNFQKWNILGNYVWPNPSPLANTYQQEINLLKNWISQRLQWMDSGLKGVCQTVSTNDLAIAIPFTIAPNPADQFIRITFDSPTFFQKGNFYLMNILGQPLKNIPISEQVDLSLSEYSNGLYLIGLELEGQFLYRKVVISR